MSSKCPADRRWLREASMRRLSSLMKHKTEIIDSKQKLKLSLTSVDNLEVSGLDSYEVGQLQSWVRGEQLVRCQLHFALTTCSRLHIRSTMHASYSGAPTFDQ